VSAPANPFPSRASASALSATLYLMSRIALHGGCPRLALIVMEHLDLVARDADVDPLVRETTHRLFFEWQRSIESAFGNASEQEDAAHLARDAIRKAMSA
jgi:hypothetical protein